MNRSQQEIHHIAGNIFKLDDRYPTFGFCFPVLRHSDNVRITNDVHKLIEYFCANAIPHNLLWTLGRRSDVDDDDENNEIVKIFVFPREKMADKHGSKYNVACCELSGFLSVGGKCYGFWQNISLRSKTIMFLLNAFSDESVYNILSEEFIINKIRDAMGNLNTEKLIKDATTLFSAL